MSATRAPSDAEVAAELGIARDTTLRDADGEPLSPELEAALEGIQRWTPEEAAKYVDELPEHPLFMTSSPTMSDESSNAYVAALTHMAYDDEDTPESLAKEAKDKGNASFSKGPDYYGHAIKHYNDCIDHASRAKRDRAGMKELTSVAYANLAAVYLARKKYKTCLDCCEKALKMNPKNVKAIFRAVKACLAVGRAQSARDFAELGAKLDPKEAATFDTLKAEAQRALDTQARIAARTAAEQAAKIEALRRVREAVVSRALRIGPPLFQDMRRTRAVPYADEYGLIHWPLLLLYPATGQSDYLEDVAENASIGDIVDAVLGRGGTPWDRSGEYVPENVDIFYQTGTGMKVFTDPSQWWADVDGGKGVPARAEASASKPDDDDEGNAAIRDIAKSRTAWVRVPPAAPLLFLLSQPTYVIPDIPVLLVVSRSSGLYPEVRRRSGGTFSELHVPAAILESQ